MPSRPDIRELASNVKEAFGEMDRETLLEILTFVVKEYVVEGPPPMLVHQAETVADIQNLSFAQLIAALQTRFDHPELQLFAVDGDQVSVRVGGVMQPLLGARGGAASTAPTAAELPRPAAGVRVVEANLQHQPRATGPAQTPPAAPPGVQFSDTRPNASPPPPTQPTQPGPGAAPPPSRGLSLRGRPAGEGAGPGAPSQTPPAAASPPPAAGQPGGPAAPSGQPPAASPDKPDTAGGDDASARFSLLELD